MEFSRIMGKFSNGVNDCTCTCTLHHNIVKKPLQFQSLSSSINLELHYPKEDHMMEDKLDSPLAINSDRLM
jgi:hypothetical protein